MNTTERQEANPVSPGLNPVEQAFGALRTPHAGLCDAITENPVRRTGATRDRFMPADRANHLGDAGRASAKI